MSRHRITNARRFTTRTDQILEAAAIAAQAAEDAQAIEGRSPTKTAKRLQRLVDAAEEISRQRRQTKGNK